jgi:hypothetical protein
MANIFLNDSLLSLNAYQYRNFAELLPLVKENYIGQDLILTEIKLNNFKITPDIKKDYLKQSLKTDDIIYLKTENKKSHTYDLLIELQNLMERMIKAIDPLCEAYKQSNINDCNNKITPLLNSIEIFIESYILISQRIDEKSQFKINYSNEIKEIKIHLLSILKAIKPAMNKHDTLMLTDLLQYELKDNLTKWKIQIIPLLKDLLVF